MTASLLDRAIAAVAPGLAVTRAADRLRLQALGTLPPLADLSRPADAGIAASTGDSGYTSTGGADGFLSRWHTRPRSAAADTLPRIGQQRAQARELVRNNPIAASAINTNVVRAIGTGLAYSPQPHLATLGWSPEQGAAWAAEVAAEFSLWADSTECDWTGEQNFYQLQDLVTRGRLESGDCFTVLPDGELTASMPYALRLQVLEADRVGNPKGAADSAEFAAGIRRAAGGGRVTGIHVYDRHPGSLWLGGGGDLYAGRWIEPLGSSGRRRMLHHFKRLRPEQPRGVPYLAPVMALFKQLDTYTDAEIKAAVVSAWITMIIETPAGTGVAPVFGAANPAANDGAPVDLEMGAGAVLGLAKGETAKFNNPNRPNPAFGAFVESVVDQLGAGAFIGSEMLMKKFNTSYTAARAAFLDAWKHLLDVRTGTALDFCQPVLETWMAEAVIRRRISAPGFFTDPRLRWAYTRAAWRGDSQGSLNPKDEVAAYRDAVDGLLISNERAEWELFGSDWQSTYSTKVAERKRMARDGIAPVPRAGAAAAPGAAPRPTSGSETPPAGAAA